ncbi:hypothetical protein P3L10_020453 [Capsicum annuum]
MVNNTPTKMVIRGIACNDPNVHTFSTFDLRIPQTQEEDALPSKEVSGIGRKRKVTDDALGLNNNDDELNEEGCNVEAVKDIIYYFSTVTSIY